MRVLVIGSEPVSVAWLDRRLRDAGFDFRCTKGPAEGGR